MNSGAIELNGKYYLVVRVEIKYYAGVKGTDAQDAADKLEALSKAVVEL